MKKVLNVALTINNAYTDYAGAVMCSVLAHLSKDSLCHFYILSANLSLHNQIKLLQIKKHYKCEIYFLAPDKEFIKIFQQVKLPSHISIDCFNKILLPLMLHRLDRILYLDCDLIVLGDITPLYESDLKDCAFGAVEDVNQNLKSKLGYADTYLYFNSGMWLFDNHKIDKKNYYEKIKFSMLYRNQLYSLGSDQDVLNDCFHDQIYPLSYRYNLFHEWHDRRKSFIPSNAKEYEESINAPVIRHFVGRIKPWYEGCEMTYTQEFLKSLKEFKDLSETFSERLKRIFGFCFLKTRERRLIKVFHLKIYDRLIGYERSWLKVFGICLKKSIRSEEGLRRYFLGLCYFKKLLFGSVVKKYYFIWCYYKEEHHYPNLTPLVNALDFIYARFGLNETLFESVQEICKLYRADQKLHLLFASFLCERREKQKALELIYPYVLEDRMDTFFYRKLCLCELAYEHLRQDNEKINERYKIYKIFEENMCSDSLKLMLLNKSIAVVGNSPSALGKSLGKQIDKHDLVIRFNNYSVDTLYWADYGQKTDIWVVGCGGDDVKLKKESFDAVVFGQDVRYFREYHYEMYRYFALETSTPCFYIPSGVIEDLRCEYGVNFPTTGISFIYYLSTLLGGLKSVDFYGFNFQQDIQDDISTHYFKEDQDLNERIKRSEVHDIKLESQILSQIIQKFKG